jgi:hypothetical protein
MRKLFLLFCIFLSSCGGGYFEYQNNFQPQQKPKFRLKNIEINFSEQKIKPLKKDLSTSKYLTKDQIVAITKQEIINQLKEDKVYNKNGADVLDCDFQIEYIRKFMLFTNKHYIGTVLKGYKISIYKNGKLVAKREDDDNIYFLSRGFVANFDKIKKIFTFKYNEEDEKKEVEALAHFLAKNLEKFGQ